MAHFNKRTGISALPLRHTDVGGRLRLLREAELLEGDAETGFRLMGNQTLIEATELVNPPIENMVGVIPYPLGLATNFRINGHEVLVPMAVREPTVIAGMSKAAKLALPEGFTVEVGPYNEIWAELLYKGFASDEDAEQFRTRILGAMPQAIRQAEISQSARGRIVGHNVLLISRERERDEPMVVVKVRVDTDDFMGAKIAIAMAHKVAKHLMSAVDREPKVEICSNYDSGRGIFARAIWPRSVIGQEMINATVDNQRWAHKDRHRKATHLKGILNAIMAIARVTGQDEEAISVALLTHPTMFYTLYRETRDGLEGRLGLKMPVATRGGSTQEPFAKMCRALTDVTDARGLAMIIGAAGLAANFAALHCLANEGILAAFEKVRSE